VRSCWPFVLGTLTAACGPSGKGDGGLDGGDGGAFTCPASDGGWVDGGANATYVTTLLSPAVDSPIEGIAIDKAGVVYLAALLPVGELIRIDPSTLQATTLAFASGGSPSFPSGWSDGGFVILPWLTIGGIALDSSGDVFLTNFQSGCLCSGLFCCSPPPPSWASIIRIDARGAAATLTGRAAGFLDGPSSVAQFSNPLGIAVVDDGGLIIADRGNSRVRKIDSAGNVTTLAGSGAAGDADGPGAAASFQGLDGICAQGMSVFVTEDSGNRVRRIDSSGNVSTLAGNGTEGFVDGTGGANGTTEFASPLGIAVGPSGDVFIADTLNGRVREAKLNGSTTTVAGNGQDCAVDGTGGPQGTAAFESPTALAFGPTGDLFVADGRAVRVIHFPDGGY
jgi:hypothetical protein